MFQNTNIDGLLIAHPRRHEDERGFFAETFRLSWLEDAGVTARFVQENVAHSKRSGVLRGLHFQIAPSAQGKLVHAVRGTIFDVAGDLRPGSPTWGRHQAFELSEHNLARLWIPAGFAHGYLTLVPDCVVGYMTTAYYDPALERGLAFDDADVGIAWPVPVSDMTISPKDRGLPSLAACTAGPF